MQKRKYSTPTRKLRLYRIWTDMKRRCYDEKRSEYKNYGGRGIEICQEWKNSFEAFRNWATENGYTDELTIDRIDVNGNYEPSNCRWATLKEQANNMRTNTMITYKGETKTLAQWAESFGINYHTLVSRLYQENLPFEEAVKKGNRLLRMITYKGKTQSLSAWTRELGFKEYTLQNRLRKGWTIEEAFTTPELGVYWNRKKEEK